MKKVKGLFTLEGRIRKCVEYKTVYSPKLGKNVRRCAGYKRI